MPAATSARALRTNPYQAGDRVVWHPNTDRISVVGAIVACPDEYHVNVQWERGGRIQTERNVPIRHVHPVAATCPIGAC